MSGSNATVAYGQYRFDVYLVIAANGRRFVERVVSEDQLRCHTFRYLLEYADLLE